MSILIIIVIAFISGIGKAVSDTLWFWWGQSIFAKHPKLFNPQWWNPRLSHKNKDKPKNYFIRLMTRTWLVTFTDAWHFFQFVSAFPLFVGLALVHYYGLDVFGLSTNSEVVDVALLSIALYFTRLGGNTFTKGLIREPLNTS